MKLQITQNYRDFRFREVIEWDYITQDGMNFYLGDWPDEYPRGISSNYYVLPKYAAVEVK